MSRVIALRRTKVPFEIALIFDDGKIVFRNFKKLADKGGVFEKLKDPRFFAKVRVSASKGTIQWPGGLDLCPDVLYDGEARARKRMKCP